MGKHLPQPGVVGDLFKFIFAKVASLKAEALLDVTCRAWRVSACTCVSHSGSHSATLASKWYTEAGCEPEID